MEIVYVLVTDLFCDLIYFQLVFQEKLFRQLNPFMVDIGIEILSHSLAEDLAQVGAVIAEERGDRFQLDIMLEVVVDVEEHIIQYRIPGRAADGVHDHLELF